MSDDATRREFLGATSILGAGALLVAACDAGPGAGRAGPRPTAFRGQTVDPSDFAGSPTDQLEAAVAEAGDGGVVLIAEDYVLDRTWVLDGALGVRIVGAGGRIVSELPLGIDIVDSENVVLEDLILLGAQTSNNRALRFRGANLWCSVSRCELEGFSSGVRIEGNAQHEVYVERCRFTTQDIAGSKGIELHGAVDHALVGNVVPSDGIVGPSDVERGDHRQRLSSVRVDEEGTCPGLRGH